MAAAGRPGIISGNMVKPGAKVIDVGINRVERNGKMRLVGDVGEGSATAVAVTPVPGGVGSDDDCVPVGQCIDRVLPQERLART